VQVVDLNDQPRIQLSSSESDIEFLFPEITTEFHDVIGDLTGYAVDDDRSDTLANGNLEFKIWDSYDSGSSTGTLSADFDVVNVDGYAKVRIIRDTTADPFDYEGGNSIWNLQLTLNDLELASEPVALTLKLTDVNEPPVFEDESSLALTAMETICNGETYTSGGVDYMPVEVNSQIATVVAVDPDVNQALNLNLLTENMPFRIGSSISLGDNRYRWGIILDSELDFETSSSQPTPNEYTFSLQISDGQETVTHDYTVTVLDCNEAPVLEPDEKIRSVNENFIGDITGDPLVCTDLDTSDTLIFEKVGGNGLPFFDISSTGDITSIQETDFEGGNNVYFLEVRVVDDPSATASSLGEMARSESVRYAHCVAKRRLNFFSLRSFVRSFACSLDNRAKNVCFTTTKVVRKIFFFFWPRFFF